jgi:hypothetical protein
VLVFAAILLVLNRRVYAWFARKHGAAFAAGAVLAHWSYYFYSGVVFGLYALLHAGRRILIGIRRGMGLERAGARE